MKSLLVLIMALFVGVRTLDAVTIQEIYEPGDMPTNYIGTGSFTNICHAACLMAMLAHQEPCLLTVHFQLAPVGGGVHTLTRQTGTPNREIECWVQLNNETNGFQWVFRPSPVAVSDNEFRFVHS